MWDAMNDRFISKPPQHINLIKLNSENNNAYHYHKCDSRICVDKPPHKRLSLSINLPEHRQSKRANSIARLIYNDEMDSDFHMTDRNSPFTYIKTTSIKRVPRYTRSTRSTPNRSGKNSPSFLESYRVLNQYSSLKPFENYLKNDFERNDLKSFENEIENSYRKYENFEKTARLVESGRSRQQLDQIRLQTQALRNDSNLYYQNLNLVKNLISLLEGASQWINKLEERLCNQESLSNFINLNSVITHSLHELEDIESSLRLRQNEINQIRDLTEKILTSKTNLANDISNLPEIMDVAEEIKKRYSNILSQISERQVLLGDIQHCVDLYEKAYKNENKWINMLKSQIQDYERNQIIYKQQRSELREKLFDQQQQQPQITNMQDDINDLKNSFDPVARIFTELGTRSSHVDFLNETGIQLVTQLQKFNELLTDYRQNTINQSLETTNTGSDSILNQIRLEVNSLNSEYASLLNEYNQKVKTIINSISKSDKQFTVHITFENAEPLIEKYSRDLFELANSNDLIHKTTTNYYYYDTNLKNSLNINNSEAIMYPLSFIDAVNKKQLDLDTGFFKDPKTNSFTLGLGEAIQKNLLNSKTAYITDPQTIRSSDLQESINLGLITSNNRVLLSPNFTLSLGDALKTGHLKIGQNNNPKNCTISSETQSMSIRSIKDPNTGEFIAPTEAIKRKLLDPYKGQFYNPVKNEKISISEAINRGYVLVEINSPSISNDRETNIVSTSLIRETKSYHLLGVFDPLKNDEISIKEAISRGILDRQRGLYIHPQTKEMFSISDAINKGVIRARIIKPTSNALADSYQTLVSTSRFEENKSYTITGAIDPRTNKKVSLNQAIKDGLIDPKNGSYVNILTGETISINKAIELNLVLTDNEQNIKPLNKTEISKPVEIKTLNIEYVKDPRTGRNISVSEAMQIGLLDRNSLNYTNPLTNESISLNKAYERGLIIGHYTECYNQTSFSSSVKTQREELSYFIIDMYDPISNKSLNLDQAIQQGLFDHSRGVYIHPISKEIMSIGEAVKKGLINAQIFSGDFEPKRFDSRLPIGDFGIDKKIRSMRTKFNKDGTSVLQIDIESTKPIKGVYEVDEIEELTCNEPLNQDYRLSHRQVIDINSVHRINEENKTEKYDKPIHNLYKDKNIVNIEINKELGSDLKIRRIEDVVEDDRSGVVRIQVDKNNNNKQIPERKTILEKSEKVQTLVIDDSKQPSKPVSIDGQTHFYKKEIQIAGDAGGYKKNELINLTNVKELDEKLKQMEKSQQVKVKSAEIVDTYTKRQSSHIDIEPDYNIVSNREKKISIVVDIKTETTTPQEIPLKEISEEKEVVKKIKNDLYEDTTIIQKIPNIPLVEEEDEETFEEWTEVYTITIRGIRYKILWVYDPLKCENVTLVEGIKRGIIDLKNGVYHNLKTSHSQTISEAVDDGLIGIEEDTSALTIKVNGITYTIYWVWDPVKKRRISPKRAIERQVLDLKNNYYRNYSNNETISIHEAVYMKLIGASDDLTNIEEELTLEISNTLYRIAWVKDSRTGEKFKPREALRRGLLDLTNYLYNKYDTNEALTIKEAIRLGFIGLSNESKESDSEFSDDGEFERQDSLSSLDDEELTIKTKTAIYVITGLLHPVTQKEIKVSEAIKSGILDKDNGTYKDFKTNVTYEVGEAINEGFVFATVTDLLQDETASTEFIREEIKKFIVKSVIDPRNNQRIGGLQAQAAGILNYAQGMYTNPDKSENMSITEAINRNLIEVSLQEETAHEEFDAEVVTETLMERTITIYRILGVIDPFSNEVISASEAVHRQVIDTETNSYVDGSSNQDPIPIKEAVRRNLIKAEISETIERKPLGLTLQNAIRLGLFNPDSGKFKDLYTNKYFDLNQAIEKGHINPNGAAIAESSTGSLTLNEAFQYSIFNKRTGVLDRNRLSMFKGKIVEAKIYKWNFEDAVKCGLISLKNGKFKHQQSGEVISIKEAISRGLIDGDSVILDDVLTNTPMTLREGLETKIKIDSDGNILSIENGQILMSLEQAFNTRKICSAFDENTGEIFLVNLGKLVQFEKAIRKNKMDKSMRIFDPKCNKDLSLTDCIERCVIDKTSGMVIDPKGHGGLLSIKEAVKRGILSITGAPLVTGHHNSETIETPMITSRKTRHIMHKFDDISEPRRAKTRSDNSTSSESNLKSKSVTKTPIVYDMEYLNSDLVNNNLLTSGGASLVTNVKTTNEEHRKKISGSDVKETLRADYKETVIKPGEVPVVTSSANYEKEYRKNYDGRNLDDDQIHNVQTRFSVKSSNQDSFERICEFVDDLIQVNDSILAQSTPKTNQKNPTKQKQLCREEGLDLTDKDLINFLRAQKDKLKSMNDINFISEIDLR
ncbi:unnamed protein product [Brachionus calyciflorus]|uniref:Uncharacterized protein n=1 Tax=Brachionus calyciflorus TaxID=104777 RepID=A0A813M7P1_9BILA|nr:unnamed protein product [Brachionus calyciflorus]